MRIRITKIDEINSYNRHHPPKIQHRMQKCVVLYGENYQVKPMTSMRHVENPQHVAPNNQIFCWTVVTDTGELLEVMEHEGRVL